MFKLKEKAEDFQVKEIIDLKVHKEGPYAYFLLKKKNWTTPQAIEKLAEALKVDKKLFSVAGMKDKYGITEQHVCIKRFDLRRLEKVHIQDISFTPVGYGTKRIGIGSLSSNIFTLVVRNLDESLQPITYMPNYYDDQRFGEIRPNTHLVGKAIVQRKYEEAMKIYLGRPFFTETPDHRAWREKIEKQWGNFDTEPARGMFYERKVLRVLQRHPKAYVAAFQQLPRQLLTLFVQAYQSYLYNLLLNKYINKHYSPKRFVHTVVGDYAASKPNEEDRELELPMIGCTPYHVHHSIEPIITEIIKKERLRLRNFQNKSWEDMTSRTIMRKAFVLVKNLKIGKLEADELNKNKFKQAVSFKLQKGSYATMAVKCMHARSDNPR